MQDNHTLSRLLSEVRGLDEPTDLPSREGWIQSVLSSAPIDKYERITQRCADEVKRLRERTLDNEAWLGRVFASLGIFDHSVAAGEINYYGDLADIPCDLVSMRLIREMGLEPYEEDGLIWGDLPRGVIPFPEFILPRGNSFEIDPGVSSPTQSIDYLKYILGRFLRPLRKDDPVSVKWNEWTVGPRIYIKARSDSSSGKLIIAVRDCALISQTGKSSSRP